MEHRRGQARQLAGFVQTQQRQQAGVFHLARIRAVHPGNVAPDSDPGGARQRADLGGRVVRPVTAQQDGFAGLVAGDKAGHHQTFVRMLRHQLLQQWIG